MMAWCRRRWRDQCSAKARRALKISPAAYCLARPANRAVSAIDSLMGAMPGGQGWPPRTGTGASPRGVSRSASLISPSSHGVAGVVPGAGELDVVSDGRRVDHRVAQARDQYAWAEPVRDVRSAQRPRTIHTSGYTAGESYSHARQ